MKKFAGNRIRIFLSFCFAVILCGVPAGLHAAGETFGPPYTPEQQQVINFLQDAPLKAGQQPLRYGCNFSPEDYAVVGVKPGKVAPWEDARRTDPEKNTFEWWYFDMVFTDGSTAVVLLFTKPFICPRLKTMPLAQILITTPSGEMLHTLVPYKDLSLSSFSATQPDVKVGGATMTGDLKTYHIKGSVPYKDSINGVDLVMTGIVPPLRFRTGLTFLGDKDTYLGWLSAIPSGTVTGTITYQGKTHTVTGNGYHDHNWGTMALYDHFKYWYWGRAQVGPYTVLLWNSYMKNRYGKNAIDSKFAVVDASGTLLTTDSGDVSVTQTKTNTSAREDFKEGDSIAFEVKKKNGDWVKLRLDPKHMMLTKNLIPYIQPNLTPFEHWVLTNTTLIPYWDPHYARYHAKASLSFRIKGKEYSGEGIGVAELMDLQ